MIMSNPIENRYDFVVLFDVENGNPNGDPDSGNMPRIDPETGYGIVTDVCLKRKIRNYVDLVKDGDIGYNIYVKKGSTLNAKDNEALTSVAGVTDVDKAVNELKVAKDPNIRDLKLRDFMCENYYDIRTFGAVMTTFVRNNFNCGQVTGPVQLCFARSVDPVFPQYITITRQAITTENDAQKKNNAMGNKYVIPYALYRAEGFVSAKLAQKVTGFSEEDLKLLWEAIINMFEHDHSAARGKMIVRELVVFKHDSALGNAPSHKLFEKVRVDRKDLSRPARSYSDYSVTVEEDMPDGVTLERKIK